MGVDKKMIGVVPIGTISELVPKTIAAHILAYLNLNACVTAPLMLPANALDPGKYQYDAGLVLEDLERTSPSGYDKIIGVLEVDLSIPLFSYVYGEARQGGMCAVVSTFRLQTGRNSMATAQTVLLERSAKVALHELGHLFNLTHCRDIKCLMHFSGDLQILDQSSPSFCRYCRAFWRSALDLH